MVLGLIMVFVQITHAGRHKPWKKQNKDDTWDESNYPYSDYLRRDKSTSSYSKNPSAENSQQCFYRTSYSVAEQKVTSAHTRREGTSSQRQNKTRVPGGEQDLIKDQGNKTSKSDFGADMERQTQFWTRWIQLKAR